MQEAVRESIRSYGFIDPVLVRPAGDGYEIIDGEHRWQAAVDEGHEMVDVVVVNVDEAEAKKLTVILNETRGAADAVDLAHLLAEIKPVFGDDLKIGLPWTPEELDDLLALATDSWQRMEEPAPAPVLDDDWFTLTCRVPQSAQQVLDDALSLFYRDRDRPASVDAAWGLVVEALCADYLGGPG